MPQLSKVGSEMLDGALPALDGSSLTGVGVDGVTSSADATAMTITSAEYVGIGTTDPQRILSVGTHGTGNSEISMGASTSGQSGILFGDATNAVAKGYIQYQHSTDHFRIATNDAEALRLHSNQVVSAPGGIALGVGTANTASNVMEDYEEGTFTPEPRGTTGSAGTWAHSMGGTYVKIGNLVWFRAYGVLTNKGSWSGSCSLNGLPFTCGAEAAVSIASYPDASTDAAARKAQTVGGDVSCRFFGGTWLGYHQAYSTWVAGQYLSVAGCYHVAF